MHRRLGSSVLFPLANSLTSISFRFGTAGARLKSIGSNCKETFRTVSSFSLRCRSREQQSSCDSLAPQLKIESTCRNGLASTKLTQPQSAVILAARLRRQGTIRDLQEVDVRLHCGFITEARDTAALSPQIRHQDPTSPRLSRPKSRAALCTNEAWSFKARFRIRCLESMMVTISLSATKAPRLVSASFSPATMLKRHARTIKVSNTTSSVDLSLTTSHAGKAPRQLHEPLARLAVVPLRTMSRYLNTV